MPLNNNTNTTFFRDGATLELTPGYGAVWVCPVTHKQFTHGSYPTYAASRTGAATYPSSGAIVHRARKNAVEELNNDYSDLFLNDMIWASTIGAQSLLQKNKERFRATNDVLFDNLSRGIADEEQGEISNI